jgi:hypothetical protein
MFIGPARSCLGPRAVPERLPDRGPEPSRLSPALFHALETMVWDGKMAACLTPSSSRPGQPRRPLGRDAASAGRRKRATRPGGREGRSSPAREGVGLSK